MGSRAAEGTAPHGDHTGRGDRKLKGRRLERARGSVNMEKIRKIRRSQVMESFESIEKKFEFNPKNYWKPVQLLENGNDVMGGRSSGDDVGRRILDQLNFILSCIRKTREKFIGHFSP